MDSESRNPAVGRVALVTGAARGIGAATVRVLVEAGYFVVAVDDCGRRGYRPFGHSVAPSSRSDLAALVGEFEGQVQAAVVDVADAEALRTVCEAVMTAHGRLDVVVAAAAILDGGVPLWECPSSMVKEMLEVDVLGVWNTVAVAVPHVLASPDPSSARIVIVTSAAATRGLYQLSAYAMAKHAALGIMRAAAADLVGTGVVALAVSPGSTDTAMLAATAEVYGIASEELISHQALGRMIEPGEVAEAIRFACSPAGAALQGSVLVAEGGFS